MYAIKTIDGEFVSLNYMHKEKYGTVYVEAEDLNEYTASEILFDSLKDAEYELHCIRNDSGYDCCNLEVEGIIELEVVFLYKEKGKIL